MFKSLSRVGLAFSFCLTLGTSNPSASAAPRSADQILDAEFHKLGRRISGDKSKRPQVDVPFESTANASEFTLQVTHREVIQPWFVELNGQRLGQLPLSYKTERQSYFIVPAGTLKNGRNTLTVVSEAFAREISVGNFLLFRQSLRELLQLRTVSVAVTDAASGKPIPARITIVSDQGTPAEIFNVSATNVAVRTGLIYTTGTRTTFELPEGRYAFSATRGMEWSLDQKTVTLTAGKAASVELRIRRQVDTTGFIAADTHIHTLYFSDHGDATVDERMVTLAGEGVELAIATDHNHHTDFRPHQTRLEFNRFFTPVTGNEVSTRNGHFNAFPMPLEAELPNHRETNWVVLMQDIRSKGAKVVIFNHPRYPDPTNNVLTKFDFNRASGDRPTGPAFTFNAMELVNSSSPSTTAREEVQADPLRLLTDWFAVLNHGENVTGVGASDSHTVGNPVGQGRTYIRSSTDDPARLDVDELCRNFLAGDKSVSYGIFADVTVNRRYHMGQLVRPERGKVDVRLRVAAPDWVQPRRAIVFLNGVPVAEKKLKPAPGKPFAQRLTFSIAAPRHDAHLVCAVFGDGVTAPYWKTLGNYTAAVTNPLYLDGDGDGRYQSPRDTARKLLAATDGTLSTAWAAIEKADDALAGQMLGLLYTGRDANFVRQLDARVRIAAAKRPLYALFLEQSPVIVVTP